MRKIGFISSLIIILLSGCKKHTDVFTFKSEHFVNRYYNLESISSVSFYTDNVMYIELVSNVGNFVDKTKSEQLYKKHNDENYKFQTTNDGYGFMGYSAVSEDFVNFEIVSDKAFDTSHPSGISLSDIVDLVTVSPILYIQSGYKSMYSISSDEKQRYPNYLFYPSYYDYGGAVKYTNNFPWHLIKKNINELTKEDLTIIGQPLIVRPWNERTPNIFPRLNVLAVLQLPEPEEKGRHTITITISTDSYKKYKTTTEIVFE